MTLMVLSVAFSWLLFPRLCLFFDRRITQRAFTSTSSEQSAHQQATPRHASHFSDAEILESLAMRIRGGMNAQSALEEMAQSQELPEILREVLQTHYSEPLDITLVRFQAAAVGSQYSDLASLLSQSCRYGSLEPMALDEAARAVRATRQQMSRLLVASAQARFTVKVLTSLPLLSVAIGSVFSSTFRSSLQQPAVLAIVVAGICLNSAGYVWMKKIATVVKESARPTPLHQLVTSMCISLHAGDSLLTAIEKWDGSNSVGTDIASRLSQGESLANALLPLERDGGNAGRTVRRLLLDNHQMGTPLSELVVRLQEDVESEISHRTNIGIQHMATKLTFPVVFCILPSFVLLALLPVVVSSFSSLSSTSLS